MISISSSENSRFPAISVRDTRLLSQKGSEKADITDFPEML